MTRPVRLLVVLSLAALVLAGCAAPAAPATSAPATAPAAAATEVPKATQAPTAVPKPKAITIQAGGGDPRSIDPQKAIDTREWYLLEQLFPPLLVLNTETHASEPGVAQSYDISADGKVYTFHLTEKVPWVRYNPSTKAVEQVTDDKGQVRYLKAQDFVYGFLRALDPKTGSPAAYMLAPYIAGAADYNAGKGSADQVAIKALDDNTLQITAPEKVGFALQIFGIINARAVPSWDVEQNGDAWTDPKNINCYGPFVLKDWTHEASMTYVKNPFWPGTKGIQKPALDEITFRFIDETVGLREFEAGTIDMTIVPGTEVLRVQADPKLGPQLKIVPGTCTNYYSFNVNQPPFNNVHIRRALTYAVDRDTLTKEVLAGGEIPAPFLTPPSINMAPAATDAVKDGIKYDPAKAKEELALGLKDLGLASADQLPQITVWLNNQPTSARTAQALQSMWQKELGIKVELLQIDAKVYWAKLEKESGQINMAGWCPDYNDANNYLRDIFRSDSIYNYGKYSNPKFDSLVDQARVESDPAKRLALYTEAEKLLCVEDAGIIMLNYASRAQVTNPRVKRTYSLTAIEHYWDWDVTN